jgi:hypothetical protein
MKIWQKKVPIRFAAIHFLRSILRRPELAGFINHIDFRGGYIPYDLDNMWHKFKPTFV